MSSSSNPISEEEFSLYLKKYFQVFDNEPMLNAGSAWLGHLAFARWIIDCLKPRMIVELGVHTGVSYCTFCQSVKAFSLNASCYGIDTWQGDEHSGKYSADILGTLRSYHDPLYSSFSRLIQSTFDEALSYFPDQSIDLLHIDGLHTHDAVRHDFETWLPKLSPHAVVLFHDTNVRENHFGVWKFWEEVRQNRPHFTFLHGHGLGVLGVGADLPSSILPLFQAGQAEQQATRTFFSNLSQPFAAKMQLVDEKNHLLQEVAQARDERSFLRERFHKISTDQEALIKQVAEISQEAELTKTKNDNNFREILFKLEEPVQRPSSFKNFLYRFIPLSQQEALKKKKLDDDIQYLKKSPLFDSLWYIGQYPDVQVAGLDAATHFVLHGELEGRKPDERYDAHRHLSRAISYRKLAFTGSYYVAYLKLLQNNPGFLNTFEVDKKLTGGRSTDKPLLIEDFFEGASLKRHEGPDKIDVLFIGHVATVTGAPIALLELIRELAGTYPINPHVILMDGGPLIEEYKSLTRVLYFPKLLKRVSEEQAIKMLVEYFANIPGPKLVLANTIVISDTFCRLFTDKKIPYFVWIHEMADYIEKEYEQQKIKTLSNNATALVFMSQLNYQDNVSRFKLREDNLKLIELAIRPKKNDPDRNSQRTRLREELGIPSEAQIVLACGTVYHRKGPDLFVQVAVHYFSEHAEESSNVHFLWLGHFSPLEIEQLHGDLRRAGLQDRVHFIGEDKNSHRYFESCDAFLLTSRSEPMGLVALEAIGCKIPVIGFENASGAIKYISQGFGSVVPYLNIAAMSGELHKYLSKTISIRSDGDVFLSQEHSVEKSRDSFYQEFRNALKTETQNPGRTVLILSAVPPPLFGSRVEGGGLRAWGLARSIKRMLPDHAVTFCYFHPSPASGNKISQGYYEDIFVTECAPNKLSDIVRNFSTVLMSYCMGGHSKEILAALASDQQLILDCYVPIYVEICARRSNQVQIEYDGLMSEIPTFNLALKRGDFFLCANQAQYDFYRGVLAALGRINPKTYGDMGLRIVPYGIDSDEPIAREQPIKKLLGHEYPKSWKLLWFGAVYPWFNIDILVNAIQLLNEKHPTQMIMVGARNPFNGHPDFIKKSNHVEALVSSPGVSHLIHMQEWVPYEERANWYLDCDLIITLNEPGMENGLSWRTRVADYVWAGMPIASNGGDPLTEDLIARGAAGRLDISSTEKLSESIYKLLADEVGLKKMKEQMQAFRPNLYWDKVIKPLGEIIQNHSVAPDRVS